MADNTDEPATDEQTENADLSAAEESAAEPIDTGMDSEQSFAFWLVLLPFLAFAAVQIYEFSQGSGTEQVKLINAAGLVVTGIFAAYFVNAITQGDKNSDEAEGEAKAEGSS